VDVDRADVADQAGVVETLAAAFFGDPVWGWFFPDRGRRTTQIASVFRLLVDSGLAHGWVWTTPSYEAATLWIPPGCAELNDADAASLEPLVREMVSERADLVLEGLGRFEAAHPTGVDHFYLSLFGTHPSHRGAGIGLRVLEANLAEIDAQGSPAYLESTNPANLVRYQAVGFAATGRFDLPDGGPSVTTMWREPR
jgi:GNAT superfamily N-acetyltransferase